jgi:hypothetical protein
LVSIKIWKGVWIVTVKIDDIQRVEGRVVKLWAFVGDIEIIFARPKDEEYPKEVSRRRHGVQVLDQDSLQIPPGELPELCRKVNKIFSEVRKVRPVKSYCQGKLF